MLAPGVDVVDFEVVLALGVEGVDFKGLGSDDEGTGGCGDLGRGGELSLPLSMRLLRERVLTGDTRRRTTWLWRLENSA